MKASLPGKTLSRSRLRASSMVSRLRLASQNPVFVSQGKIYQIENQDLSGLAMFAGASVKATGEVSKDGKSVKISKLDPTN